MDIDFVREAELDSMIALMSEAFEMDYTAARRVFLADPYLDFQNKRVLRVEGRVVSCLSLIPTECWIGEAQVSFAGIAGVATRPKERRKGYAGLLLADGVRLLQERGFAVAGLIPYDIAFYRKFGWEVGSTTYQLRTLPNHLPLFPERRAVRMASAADTPALDALYTTFAQNRTLHCPRNETRWRYLLAMVKQSVVYANTSGEVEGYLFYEHILHTVTTCVKSKVWNLRVSNLSSSSL